MNGSVEAKRGSKKTLDNLKQRNYMARKANNSVDASILRKEI